MDFAIWGPIARDDLPGLCDRVCALLQAGATATTPAAMSAASESMP